METRVKHTIISTMYNYVVLFDRGKLTKRNNIAVYILYTFVFIYVVRVVEQNYLYRTNQNESKGERERKNNKNEMNWNGTAVLFIN